MTSFERLQQWIHELAALIDVGTEPESHFMITFLRDPKLGLELVDLIDAQEDSIMDTAPSYFAALIFALDICVAQFQNEAEAGVKTAKKWLNQFMDHLASILLKGKHKLTYWMPVLNSFYDVHVEVTEHLREAYLQLASFEDEVLDVSDPVVEIKEMIAELSDLSDFDIAENFFSQSHAMPPEFFAELLVDLYSLKEGEDIGLLCLLHPNQEVRDVVVATLNELMPQLKLSSHALSRLKRIKTWYPHDAQKLMDEWIKMQRKKEVVFDVAKRDLPIVKITATEVDGSGAQGLFIQFKAGRRTRLCGLLFKLGYGIKDVWLTDPITKKEVQSYYDDAFENNVTLREVDCDYLVALGGHFMAINKELGHVPNLYYLELEELLGFQLQTEPLDVDGIIQTLGVQINPFHHEAMELSFKRSKVWLSTKSFTETWYLETAEVDKLVSRCSSFINGALVCDIEKATHSIMEQAIERDKSVWIFHFLWLTLWLKAHVRKNEKTWQDSFFIVYALYTDYPVEKIPVMVEIAKQTVINSIETMQERRTHLSTE